MSFVVLKHFKSLVVKRSPCICISPKKLPQQTKHFLLSTTLKGQVLRFPPHSKIANLWKNMSVTIIYDLVVQWAIFRGEWMLLKRKPTQYKVSCRYRFLGSFIRNRALFVLNGTGYSLRIPLIQDALKTLTVLASPRIFQGCYCGSRQLPPAPSHKSPICGEKIALNSFALRPSRASARVPDDRYRMHPGTIRICTRGRYTNCFAKRRRDFVINYLRLNQIESRQVDHTYVCSDQISN